MASLDNTDHHANDKKKGRHGAHFREADVVLAVDDYAASNFVVPDCLLRFE